MWICFRLSASTWMMGCVFCDFRDNNFIKDFPQLADGLMVIPLPVEEQCRGVLSEPLPNLQLLSGNTHTHIITFISFSQLHFHVSCREHVVTLAFSLWPWKDLNVFSSCYSQMCRKLEHNTELCLCWCVWVCVCTWVRACECLCALERERGERDLPLFIMELDCRQCEL